MKLNQIFNGKLLEKIVDNVSFDLQTEILVVGAGCAGIYASLSASQEGAKVTLIEKDSNVGGMHVNGQVGGYYYGFTGGEFERIDEQSKLDEPFFMQSAYKDRKHVQYLKELNENNINLLLKHLPTGVYLEDDKVVGLKVFNGKKEINVKAKMTIDATSDGHVIKMLPINKRLGRPLDGKTVPFSVISNYVWNNIRCGVNQDAGHVNQYDCEELSRKIIFAHKNASATFSKGDFLGLATHTGVREGISFEGEDSLDYKNVIFNKLPQKVLFNAYSDLDRHGNDRALDEEEFQSWWVVSNLATVALTIPVPLGAVIPKGIKGIVTAGRCFSCDTYSQSAVRMIRDMFRMGECVGVLSALCVKYNVNPLNLEYDKYLAVVTKRGCYQGQKDKIAGFSSPSNSVPYKPLSLDVDENLPLLNTRTPGAAIWSCYVSKEQKETADKVFNIMQNTTSEIERKNCALALGLMGDDRALEVLRQTVKERDCFYLLDCRRSNQFRTAQAICLLGRLGNQEDVDLLESIVFSDSEIEKQMYHTLTADYLYYKHNDRNFVYFDVFTHASASLVKLYKRLSKPLSPLYERFRALMEDEKIIKRITTEPQGTPAYDEIKGFMEQMLKQTHN